MVIFVEIFQTHILCSVTFFFENHAFYEIMLKNAVESYRPQMTMWCMHIACWVTKLADTHSAYVIIIAFPL